MTYQQHSNQLEELILLISLELKIHTTILAIVLAQ